MKKFIIAVVITACLALCAPVWPQAETVEKTPVPTPMSAVTAPFAAVPEPEPTAIAEPAIVTELNKEASEPIPAELATPTLTEQKTETEPATEQEPEPPALEQEYEPEPEITPEPPAPEPSAEQNGDMVYVPGFGWLENQGPQPCRVRRGYVRKRK